MVTKKRGWCLRGEEEEKRREYKRLERETRRWITGTYAVQRASFGSWCVGKRKMGVNKKSCIAFYKPKCFTGQGEWEREERARERNKKKVMLPDLCWVIQMALKKTQHGLKLFNHVCLILLTLNSKLTSFTFLILALILKCVTSWV